MTWAIEPQGLFSRHYDLYQGDDHITTLQMGFWREGCEFAIAGHAFAIRRAPLWKDGFQLVAGESVVCEVRRNFWSRKFALEAAEQSWTLKPAGFFTTAYHLVSSAGERGRISRRDWWSRRRVANFEPDVPPPVQVLAIFLVLIVASRQSKSQ
jgi:hypothetical protein